jgi:D-proline reductase (dithiol) PrdB
VAGRLVLVSSGGFYVPGLHAPFDATNPPADYSARVMPPALAGEAVASAHTHYDHAAFEDDPQVRLPLDHLRDMMADGHIGQLAPPVLSFMSYQPDVVRGVDETAAAMLDVAQAEEIDALLLVTD